MLVEETSTDQAEYLEFSPEEPSITMRWRGRDVQAFPPNNLYSSDRTVDHY